MHSTKGDRKQAIHYYVEVLNDPEVELNARLTAVTSLIKEYYSIYDFDKTKEMVDRGIEMLDNIKNKEAFRIHYYVINSYNYVINQDNENFEMLVINEFIPYLQKHKDFANLVDYAKMLGRHFEKLNKYKDSVKYYKLANVTYEELINL